MINKPHNDATNSQTTFSEVDIVSLIVNVFEDELQLAREDITIIISGSESIAVWEDADP